MHAVKAKVVTRWAPHVRREQLLDIGAAMFAEMPYDDVLVEDIAARAGVSRALFYYYYEGKRDLYVAMFKRSSTRLLARVSFDPQVPLANRIALVVNALIQSFVDNPFEAVTLTRAADDAAIEAIVVDELRAVSEPLIDQLVADGRRRAPTEVAVESWLAFVRAACVKWIESSIISRDELYLLCIGAFDCALNIPTAAGRLRHRVLGIALSPAVNSLIRRTRSATTARS